MGTKKIKVRELRFDESLIALRPINIFFVSRYLQAYRAGAKMPQVVIDEKTGMIVSGNHRASAMMKEYSEDYEIEVKQKRFKNRAELLKFFTLENSTHGNPLSGMSRKLIARELIENGASMEELSQLFNLPIKRIEKMGEETAIVIGKNKKQVIKPVKRGPVIKKPITMIQYKEHKNTDRGLSFKSIAEQIIRWERNGWIERNDENLRLAQDLITVMSEFVEAEAVTA